MPPPQSDEKPGILVSKTQPELYGDTLNPGTKKDAGTAIRASKLSPRVQDGLILREAASCCKNLRCSIFGEAPRASLQNLHLPQNLQPPISGEAPRASHDCLHCQLQVQLLRHLVLHTCEAPRASPIIGERKFSLMSSWMFSAV